MNAEDLVADIKSKMTDKKRKKFSDPSRRSVKRPEEILRDVRGLKLRQRVSLVLGDEILREELEDSIKNSTMNGVTKLDTIRAYQDFLLPALQPNLVSIGKGFGGNNSTVLPINDIRGENTAEFSKSERIIRCKLASVYRLVDIFGWSEAIFNHISVRPDAEKNEFLLNPFGLLFSEVTASSLVKCDVDGNLISGGSTDLGVNKAGFILHSTIHEARPDIHCVIHVHTPSVVAVASMKCGFLRISQESLIVGGVSYHDYYGILIDENEKESIKNDLGSDNMVMILRNHGVAICGKTIEDAFVLLSTFIEACDTQVKAVAVGLDNLNIISDEAYNQVQETMSQAASNVIKGEGKPHMSVNEYYFEAYMRWLDSQGYRTGYVYHMPDIFISGKTSKKNHESRVPPMVTSDRDLPYQVYYNFHESSPRHKSSMGRGNTHRARLKWLNRPVIGTQYVKEKKQAEPKTVPLEIPEENDVPEVLVNGDAEAADDGSTPNDDAEIVENATPNGDVKIVVNGDLVNGHVDDEHEEAGADPQVTNEEHEDNDQKEVAENIVITQSTSIEETKPETEEPASDSKTANDSVVIDVPSPEKSVNNTTISSNEDNLNVTSGNESTPEAGSEDGTKKVKKQKSFKKALMKKFNKKEDSKKDDNK